MTEQTDATVEINFGPQIVSEDIKSVNNEIYVNIICCKISTKVLNKYVQ